MIKFVLFFVSQALIKHKFQQKIGVSSYYIFQNFSSKSLFRYYRMNKYDIRYLQKMT